MKLFLLFTCLFLTSCTISTPQDGVKIGRIVKLSDEGLFSKTLEGELIRGGLVDGSGSLGGSFKFTIEDPRVKDIAHKALANQSEVILHYRSEFISSIFRSECVEPHFVIGIEVK